MNGFKIVNNTTLIENLPENFWDQPSLKLGMYMSIVMGQ